MILSRSLPRSSRLSSRRTCRGKALVGVAASLWVGIGIVLYALSAGATRRAASRYTPEMLGMIFAHFGVAVFLAGVLIVEATSVEKDLRFAPNQIVDDRRAGFPFRGREARAGPNYTAEQGTIEC